MNVLESKSTMLGRFSIRWVLLSAVLLAIYLAFFHACLGASAQTCQIAGVLFWLLWILVCVRFRNVLVNPFEFWIHQLVGVDILLEGFNPLHEGLGFYYCAAAFWGVLIGYHYFASARPLELAASQSQELA